MKLEDINLNDREMFVRGEHYEAFRVLRREAPVYWHERKGGPSFWAVTRYDDILKVHHDPATYSSERGISLQFNDAQTADNAGFGMMLITTDPPRHSRIRQIINRRFTPRALAAYEPHIGAISREILDSVIENGECDFVVDVAARLPTAVICEMMGVPREHWDLMFRLTNMSIGSEDPEYNQGRSAMETGQAASAQIFSIFSKMIDERRKRPGDDLVSALCLGEAEGMRLTDLEILFNCLLLIVAGQETTRNATSGGVLALIEHPDQRARFRDPAVMATAIEEILRWTSPVTHMLRVAKRDTVLGGRKVRESERVVMWHPSANRDESQFPQPDLFDVTRTPNDHLAFGHGEHFCLGANLARIELRVIIAEVMRRMADLELAGPVERLRSNFVAGIKHMPVRFAPRRASAGAAAAV
jgi:cytochrome P450